jgi:Multicopper oxidase
VIIDFSQYSGKRIIQANLGGDSPFGGDIPGAQLFPDTDKIMAFDVNMPLDTSVADNYQPNLSRETPPLGYARADRVRRVGLFEGRDEYGRPQPLLGTVEPATDKDGHPIYWPNTPPYVAAKLAGTQMSGTMTWSNPTTENIALNDVEEWEIFNLSADAHPIHPHLVAFDVIERRRIVFDSAADANGVLQVGVEPAGDGTYKQERTNVGHDGSLGSGFAVFNPTVGEVVQSPSEYTDIVRTDTVVALPGQTVRIRAKFDRLGRYVWHCHLLSHEDNEMMREFYVGELPEHGPTPTIPSTPAPVAAKPIPVPSPPPSPAPVTAKPSAAPSLKCAVLKLCALVELDTMNEVVLTGDDSYKISSASRKYSIRCDVEGPIRRFRFAYDGKTVFKGVSPYWMAGDSPASVRKVLYLAKCGSKVITVSAKNAMSEVCFTKTFRLEGQCNV